MERNARNEMGMWVWGISMGMQRILLEMLKIQGIRQGGNERNQGGNLSIAVEMRQNSNRNDKFKAWKECKIQKTSTFVITWFTHLIWCLSC